MQRIKIHVIDERAIPIPCSKNLSPSFSSTTDYSLKQNFFDPSKSSPPNDFMIKLKKRMEQMTK
jgi:hypothetical protein